MIVRFEGVRFYYGEGLEFFSEKKKSGNIVLCVVIYVN